MIRQGILADRKKVYDVHSSQVSINEYDEVERYFSYFIKPENLLVNEVNGHVVASCQINRHSMILNGRKIGVSTLMGMIARPEDRQYLDELLKEILNEQEHKNLITLAVTDKPRELKKYGFENLYSMKRYTINKKDLENRSFEGVTRSFEVKDVRRLYREFTANFNGYYYRDEEYWFELFRRLPQERKNMAVYVDSDGVAQGYMIYQIVKQKVVVHEIIYMNGAALIRLLCYGFRYRNNMEIVVSEGENLAVVFPKAKYKEEHGLMARVNNYELLNRLYGSDVRTVPGAFLMDGKPLYLNEEC